MYYYCASILFDDIPKKVPQLLKRQRVTEKEIWHVDGQVEVEGPK